MKSIRKIIVLTLVMLFFDLAIASADWPIELRYNGQRISSEVPPIIVNGTTLVPVRLISETLKYNVQWDSNSETVTIKNPDKKIIIPLNSYTANVNGDTIKLSVPAQSVNGRMMVPLRFIGESMGLEIVWDEANRLVNLYNISKNNDGKTAKEFLISLDQYIKPFNTFKFVCTVDSKGFFSSQKEKKQRSTYTIVNAFYKDKQVYTTTVYTSGQITTNIEMFFDPPKVYVKEEGKDWKQLSLDAFGSTLGGLIANMDSFNNQTIKEAVNLLSPETKIFYGNDQVFDGVTYQTVIVDYKEPGTKKLAEALVSAEGIFPTELPEGIQENYELVQYNYFNKNTANLERRKVISRVDLKDKYTAQNSMTLITEQTFKIFDLGLPITFPDQP